MINKIKDKQILINILHEKRKICDICDEKFTHEIKNCGCYVDLIKNANTGWGFDSENKLELSYLLHKVESLSNEDLKKIKENIKLKISKYDLKTFSNAVEKSIFRTLSKKKFSLISSITSYLLYKFTM